MDESLQEERFSPQHKTRVSRLGVGGRGNKQHIARGRDNIKYSFIIIIFFCKIQATNEVSFA